MHRPPGDPHLVRREDGVLLVVDVQEKLVPSIDGHVALVDNIARLVKFCGIVGVPVLHAEQIKLGPTAAPLRDAIRETGGPAEPHVKETFGCFGHPPFARALSESGRRTIFLTGIEAHVCVLQTALGALERGFRVQVVADAVGSRSPLNKEVGIRRALAAGGEITCVEALIFELLGKAGTDDFRKALPLVK